MVLCFSQVNGADDPLKTFSISTSPLIKRFRYTGPSCGKMGWTGGNLLFKTWACIIRVIKYKLNV